MQTSKGLPLGAQAKPAQRWNALSSHMTQNLWALIVFLPLIFHTETERDGTLGNLFNFASPINLPSDIILPWGALEMLSIRLPHIACKALFMCQALHGGSPKQKCQWQILKQDMGELMCHPPQPKMYAYKLHISVITKSSTILTNPNISYFWITSEKFLRSLKIFISFNREDKIITHIFSIKISKQFL